MKSQRGHGTNGWTRNDISNRPLVSHRKLQEPTQRSLLSELVKYKNRPSYDQMTGSISKLGQLDV